MGNGCEGHQCRETGTRGCSPKDGGNYRCRCKRGFAGRYCERAPSCRKKKVKQFLKENGCRSRKLVRETACQGECHGSSCCKARKTKKKKVGMTITHYIVSNFFEKKLSFSVLVPIWRGVILMAASKSCLPPT